MIGRMVFGAQDASRIVDLDHLVVLIKSTTTAGIDCRRVLIDDLWGPISDLRSLVDWGHELHRRIIERGL